MAFLKHIIKRNSMQMFRRQNVELEKAIRKQID
jgi:hypothetical protein